MDEAKYENARWWRNLNRLMIPVGVFIIAAIVSLSISPDERMSADFLQITLAVVSVRMKN